MHPLRHSSATHLRTRGTDRAEYTVVAGAFSSTPHARITQNTSKGYEKQMSPQDDLEFEEVHLYRANRVSKYIIFHVMTQFK